MDWKVDAAAKLWILLSAPADVVQERKQEVTREETSRQCMAYVAFIRTRRDYVIVNAAQALENVIADSERPILKALQQAESKRG